MENKTLLIGTFDLFHFGHKSLIEQLINKVGEHNITIAIASDEWLKKRGKINFQDQFYRKSYLEKKYKNICVCFENSTFPFSAIPEICKKYSIETIALGEDQIQMENNIKNILKLNEVVVDFIYLKRTRGISSTILKERIDNDLNLKKFLRTVNDYEKDLNDDIFFSNKDFSLLNPWSADRKVWSTNNYIYKFFPDNFSSQRRENDKFFNNILNESIIETKYGFIYKKIIGRHLNTADLRNSEILNSIRCNINKIRTEDKFKSHNYKGSKLPAFSLLSKVINIDPKLYKKLQEFEFRRKQYPSHGDLNHRNILVGNSNDIHFIDFDLAGMYPDFWDLSSLVSHSDLLYTEIIEIFNSAGFNEKECKLSILFFLTVDVYYNHQLSLQNGDNNRMNYFWKQLNKLKTLTNEV